MELSYRVVLWSVSGCDPYVHPMCILCACSVSSKARLQIFCFGTAMANDGLLLQSYLVKPEFLSDCRAVVQFEEEGLIESGV